MGSGYIHGIHVLLVLMDRTDLRVGPQGWLQGRFYV